MSAYQSFTSLRLTEPDSIGLLNQLKALDPTAGVQHGEGSSTYVVEKTTAWTGPQIAATQNVIDTAPAISPQLTGQNEIDRLGIREKAILLTLLDQINLIRSKLVPALGAISPAQAIQAARDKAGTL